MRICPKCGKKFPWGRMRCNAEPRCDTVTIPYIEPEPEPEIEEDLREDLQGQSDQIHDLLEEKGPLTYPEIGKALGISPTRASRLVGQMIRDGVELKREGSPRKVSLG